MKKYYKRILKSKFFSIITSLLIWFYIKLVYHTSSWRLVGVEKVEQYKEKPIIYAFWHGRLLMIAQFAKKTGKCNIIASRHSDGELIARTVTLFGVGLVRGSHKKAGSKAVLELREKIKQGENIVFTPDGPKGPCYKSKEGILFLAKKLGIDIAPIAYSTKRKKICKSWDKFLLPYPFTKGVIIVGDIIKVNDTTKLTDIDLALDKVTNQADNEFS